MVVRRIRRGMRRQMRRGFAWAHRRGLDAGPHRSDNTRWWQLVAEGNRLTAVYAANPTDAAASFGRSVAHFTRALVETQSRRARPVALGIEPLFRVSGAQDKRRALDLARDSRRVGEYQYAASVLSQVLKADPRSPLAWSYLADVHTAQGELKEARDARRRHLALSGGDVDRVSKVESAVTELTLALDSRTVEDVSLDAAASSLFAHFSQQLVAVREAGDSALLRKPLIDLNSGAQVLRGTEAVLRNAIIYGSRNHHQDLALMRTYGAATAHHAEPPPLSESPGDLKIMDVGSLRKFLDGKRLCLVANSEKVAQSGLGDLIDYYDLVVRFNSFRIDPVNTGSKTSIHALIHMHAFNWDVPVEVRVVFSGDPTAWRRSIVSHLNPNAQRYLGDESLRWPLRSADLVGDDAHPDVPTSGFNMVRLLDFLDVSEAIDLIGFDFYEGGAYRLDEAMSLPIAAAHNYNAEKAWVLSHATGVDGPIISLR